MCFFNTNFGIILDNTNCMTRRKTPKKNQTSHITIRCNNKEYLFSAEEREYLVKKSLFSDLKFKKKQIKVVTFNTLTTDFCKKMKSNVILRGLRATSDFEYEFQLSGMNKKLNDKIETVFLMSDPQNQIISSKLVKEIADLKGNVKKFTTKSVLKHLKLKLND